MPYYDIEQYEIYAQTFRVKGDNPADAIRRLLAGEGDEQDRGPDYIEACDSFGKPVRCLAAELSMPPADLREQLLAADVTINDSETQHDAWVPSIRQITMADDQADDETPGIDWKEVDRLNATRPPCYDFTPREGA